MSTLTQFTGTRGREICDVVVGFDFGTSCSKVVLRTPYHNNHRAFATPFGPLGHKSCPYLLPSVLWVGHEGRMSLEQIDRGFLLRDIKYHLMRDEPVPLANRPPDGARRDAKVVAVVFLALALREARGWFLAQQHELYGEFELRWTFNIGLPSADFADESLCRAYGAVANAAWALSLSPGGNHLQTATDLLDRPEPLNKIDDRHAAEISWIPEVAAEVAGYAKSTLRDEGLHVLVDVGATTLDVCSFVLHKSDDDDCYSLLTADVQPLGASMLYRERVVAVQKAVDDHMGKLWDQYDPVSPMADGVEAYSPPQDSIAASIRHYDSGYHQRCKKMVWKTMVDLRRNRDPRSSRWQSAIPLFVSGGGSVMPFYQSLIKNVSGDIGRLYPPCRGIQSLSLTKPENFDAEVGDQTYQRLAVAWGLSYAKTDIGTVSRPSEADDIPSREPYDWNGREFVSKDMV